MPPIVIHEEDLHRIHLATAAAIAATVPEGAFADLDSPLSPDAVRDAVGGHLAETPPDVEANIGAIVDRFVVNAVNHGVELEPGFPDAVKAAAAGHDAGLLHEQIAAFAHAAERERRTTAKVQTDHPLFWVATYHNGKALDERDAPGEVSSEQIDRKGLKHFALVEADGTPHVFIDADGNELDGLTFPKGDDPKLIYRRRSLAAHQEHIPAEEWLGPNPEQRYPWTYCAGYHHADGRLELWGMGRDGILRPDPEPDIDPDVDLLAVEKF